MPWASPAVSARPFYLAPRSPCRVLSPIAGLCVKRRYAGKAGQGQPHARGHSEFVLLVGRDIRYAAQGGGEPCTRCAFRSVAKERFRIERRQLLTERGRDQLVDRYLLPLGQRPQTGMIRIRDPQTHRAHLISPSFRNSSCGVIRSILNRSMPSKSRLLNVIIASAFPATATSSSISSFGSRNRGRQR